MILRESILETEFPLLRRRVVAIEAEVLQDLDRVFLPLLVGNHHSMREHGCKQDRDPPQPWVLHSCSHGSVIGCHDFLGRLLHALRALRITGMEIARLSKTFIGEAEGPAKHTNRDEKRDSFHTLSRFPVYSHDLLPCSWDLARPE